MKRGVIKRVEKKILKHKSERYINRNSNSHLPASVHVVRSSPILQQSSPLKLL